MNFPLIVMQPDLSLRRWFICLLFLLLLNPSAQAAVPTALLGFKGDRVSQEVSLERKFDADLNPDDQRAWMERMAAEPNQVGSPHNKANADFMLEQFRAWGWDARIETFDVLFPTPKEVHLELVAPSAVAAKLHEPALPGDRTSGRTEYALPPYNAYGGDGDVTGELVYVNRGMPADYRELDRLGISVTGRIVLARYGGGWRGLKPKLAYEHGAIGCIIYSDPEDDGYGAGDVYPKGGFRPDNGVQRGSVVDMPVYPGDPLTPGVAATEGAKRLAREDATTILKIPVLPISYRDAEPLLAALEGPVAPSGWRGGLPLTYHVGPGPAKVRLAVASEWKLHTIYNVIARIQGAVEPDAWVMRGNHHDGWVFGAWDPLSANVALMAEAKAIGALVRDGWKPRRTLVYASWDGEEPGLLGSTEWAEAHEQELRRHLVVYVNSDTNGRGFLRAGGSHSLQALVNEVAAGIQDPQTGVPVRERLRARVLVNAFEHGADEEYREILSKVSAGGDIPLQALGSGSDYSPFLQHLGVASLDIRYGGEDDDGGIYHSIYDSYDHFLRFGDPGFSYGVALAQTIGHLILRVAESDVLPLRFDGFAETVARYSSEVHELPGQMRKQTDRQHWLLEHDAFRLAADPVEHRRLPEREGTVPFLNFAPLDNALLRLKQSATACDRALAAANQGESGIDGPRLEQVNRLLQQMESVLVDEAGLPGRPWYRHMIYAPGLQTGYGVKTLPGIREAIEERRWPEAAHYVDVVARVLNDYCDRLDQVSAALGAKGDATSAHASEEGRARAL